MRVLIILMALSVFAKCSFKHKKDDGSEMNKVVVENNHTLNLPDSLFPKADVEYLKNSDINEFKKSGSIQLTRLNDHYKKLITDKIDALEKTIYEAYFYSKQQGITGNELIVLYIDSNSLEGFILINILSEGNVKYVKLTDDVCSLVDQDEEKEVVWCDSRETSFLGENKFRVVEKHIKTVDYGSHSDETKDSISYLYEALESGDFDLLSRDSIRVIQ